MAISHEINYSRRLFLLVLFRDRLRLLRGRCLSLVLPLRLCPELRIELLGVRPGRPLSDGELAGSTLQGELASNTLQPRPLCEGMQWQQGSTWGRTTGME